MPKPLRVFFSSQMGIVANMIPLNMQQIAASDSEFNFTMSFGDILSSGKMYESYKS